MSRERFFRFKKFAVSHSRSSMKVGVDAVLLGAWCRIVPDARVIDAGCGCGVISLMVAQRFPGVSILGLDIEEEAVGEAKDNAQASLWKDRVEIMKEDFLEFQPDRKVDHVVSNPPFFDAGVTEALSGREMARQAVGFSPLSLLRHSADILNPGGRVSLIAPPLWEERLMSMAEESQLGLRRSTKVRHSPRSNIKRILWEFEKDALKASPEMTLLTLTDDFGEYSDEYRRLCHDFYLKF